MLLLFLNGAAGVFVASGAADAFGVSPAVGGDSAVADAEERADNFEASGGFGQTLFSLFGAIGSLFSGIYNLVFFGPVMLQNLGIPVFFVSMFNGALSVIVVADIAGILAGRDI